ncbi:hypothetical protein AALA83_16740 [Oscillospiraceae bacterium 44-5]
MSERMEQEINRTIALLQASMPRRKSEAALLQLLNIAKNEMNPFLLLVLFFVSILCGMCLSKDVASPMVTIFCISPLPMLILFHRYVLHSNEPMRELEETLPFSYSEMLVGRAALISVYMVLISVALAILLSHSAGENFLRMALCGAIPSTYLCILLLILSAFIRNQDGLSLAVIVLWVGISYCALVLPFDRFLILLPTSVYAALLTVGAALYGMCVCKIKQGRYSYAAGIE